MKRYIINIFLFFGIVAVIDLGVGVAGDYLQAHAKGGDPRMLDNLVMRDHHDVIILGSSRAHCHYDTPYLSDKLGMDVYNAGYEGNGVVLSYGLLSMILERYQPKLVLFDVETSFDVFEYAADNNHKRYISSLKPYYRHTGVAGVIKDVSTEEWYKVHSGLLRYNSTLLSLAIDNVKSRPVLQAGYKPTYGEYTGGERPEEPLPPLDFFKLNYVEKLLQLAQEHNIPIAVVASPKYGKKNSDDLQTVKDICSKMDVPFIDYYSYRDFMAHKEWFKEPMHLNDEGARVFSRMMATEIEKLIKQGKVCTNE